MDNPERLALVRLTVEHHQQARRSRDAAISAAMAAGIAHDDVAEAAGLSASAVRKIRTLHDEAQHEEGHA